PDLALNVGKNLTGIGLIPPPVQLLGCKPELNDQIARKILRLDLAAFFAPQPDEGVLVVTHDDPSVRAANEIAAIGAISPSGVCLRHYRFSNKHERRRPRLFDTKSIALNVPQVNTKSIN